MPADTDAILAVVDRFEAVQADLAALSFDMPTASQALTIKNRLEIVARRQNAVEHRLTHQLTAHCSPVELGGKSWTEVLSHRLHSDAIVVAAKPMS